MLKTWLKNIHFFVSKLSSTNIRFNKCLKASDTHLLDCNINQLCISLNGGKDSTAVFFFTVYLLLRAESAKKQNFQNVNNFESSWSSFQNDMIKGKYDGLLFDEALMSLQNSSLLCLYLKEKEPFPEILNYLEFIKQQTPIELRIYNSPSEVDPEFIKKVSLNLFLSLFNLLLYKSHNH
jgi:hypothetical protein